MQSKTVVLPGEARQRQQQRMVDAEARLDGLGFQPLYGGQVTRRDGSTGQVYSGPGARLVMLLEYSVASGGGYEVFRQVGRADTDVDEVFADLAQWAGRVPEQSGGRRPRGGPGRGGAPPGGRGGGR